MVGLSVILESFKDLSEERSPQVISKGSMIKPPSNPSSPTATTPSSPNGPSRRRVQPNLSYTCGFLEHCFLCKQKLLPGKDIYMYKGDRAFCSEECRCRQVFMDEEEAAAKASRKREYSCSRAAASSPSSSSSSSPSQSRGGKGARSRRNAFAY